MNDAMEYFAEASEAFFSRNDFFPFTRDELQAHDPAMFALLAKLWGVPLASLPMRTLLYVSRLPHQRPADTTVQAETVFATSSLRKVGAA